MECPGTPWRAMETVGLQHPPGPMHCPSDNLKHRPPHASAIAGKFTLVIRLKTNMMGWGTDLHELSGNSN